MDDLAARVGERHEAFRSLSPAPGFAPGAHFWSSRPSGSRPSPTRTTWRACGASGRSCRCSSGGARLRSEHSLRGRDDSDRRLRALHGCQARAARVLTECRSRARPSRDQGPERESRPGRDGGVPADAPPGRAALPPARDLARAGRRRHAGSPGSRPRRDLRARLPPNCFRRGGARPWLVTKLGSGGAPAGGRAALAGDGWVGPRGGGNNRLPCRDCDEPTAPARESPGAGAAAASSTSTSSARGSRTRRCSGGSVGS